MEGDVTVSFCFAADRLSLCGRLCRPFLPPSADLGRRSVTFSARFEGDEGGVEAKRSEAERSGAERSGARCGRRRRKAARLLALLRGDWRGRRRRERDRRGGPGVGMCGGSLIPGDAHAHATQGPEGDRARWARPDAARAIPHCSPVHANFYVPVPVAVGDPREKGGAVCKILHPRKEPLR
jgi:hypothetical protein